MLSDERFNIGGAASSLIERSDLNFPNPQRATDLPIALCQQVLERRKDRKSLAFSGSIMSDLALHQFG